jgi:hypothetical protein
VCVKPSPQTQRPYLVDMCDVVPSRHLPRDHIAVHFAPATVRARGCEDDDGIVLHDVSVERSPAHGCNEDRCVRHRIRFVNRVCKGFEIHNVNLHASIPSTKERGERFFVHDGVSLSLVPYDDGELLALGGREMWDALAVEDQVTLDAEQTLKWERTREPVLVPTNLKTVVRSWTLSYSYYAVHTYSE